MAPTPSLFARLPRPPGASNVRRGRMDQALQEEGEEAPEREHRAPDERDHEGGIRAPGWTLRPRRRAYRRARRRAPSEKPSRGRACAAQGCIAPGQPGQRGAFPASMTGKIQIKVCGLTSAAGVDLTRWRAVRIISGSTFTPKSPRHVTLAQFSAISTRIPRGARGVAVAVEPAPGELTAMRSAGIWPVPGALSARGRTGAGRRLVAGGGQGGALAGPEAAAQRGGASSLAEPGGGRPVAHV